MIGNILVTTVQNFQSNGGDCHYFLDYSDFTQHGSFCAKTKNSCPWFLPTVTTRPLAQLAMPTATFTDKFNLKWVCSCFQIYQYWCRIALFEKVGGMQSSTGTARNLYILMMNLPDFIFIALNINIDLPMTGLVTVFFPCAKIVPNSSKHIQTLIELSWTSLL